MNYEKALIKLITDGWLRHRTEWIEPKSDGTFRWRDHSYPSLLLAQEAVDKSYESIKNSINRLK